MKKMFKFIMYKFPQVFLQLALIFSILFSLTSAVRGGNSAFEEVEEGRILAKLTAEVIVKEGAAPVFSGGSGTEDDPYIISTPEQLNEVRNYLSSCFELGADLDLDCEPFNTGEGWMPIGTGEEPFTGRMDGNGYLIRNLYIKRTATNYRYIGLFGYAEDAVFKRLQLENVDIRGYNYVGGVVGHNVSGIINECCSTGSIAGLGYCVGGLVGFNDTGSEINNSYSKCSIAGIASSAGGLVGENYGSIADSYATGSVEGKNAGGLVWSNYGTINRCYAAGSVTSNGYRGGLVAIILDPKSVNDSYWNWDTVGPCDSSIGVPLTIAAMRQQDSFVGWDFTDVWRIINGETYPYLWWQNII
ncbi:MAG: hypothetical protein GX263_09785 [Firmicutes bacterium]|jgi:hypothetical protein|nr:hypothetical protein [Bacillota bacterium]